MFDHELPHIQSYDEAFVRHNQPWLTDREHEICNDIGREMEERMSFFDTAMQMVLPEAAEEEAPRTRRHLFCNFILTEDMRIVEEPNMYRWSMFLKKGMHRYIHNTVIQEGREKNVGPWSHEFETKRNREYPPDFKGHVNVSTVFIGTGSHELFETMIFGGWLSTQKWRQATLLDAKKSHWAVVELAREHQAFMRRRGRWAIKQWRRVETFWRLARQRGKDWAWKHKDVMTPVMIDLDQIPGRPPTAQPNWIMDLAQTILANASLVPDPLVENPEF